MDHREHNALNVNAYRVMNVRNLESIEAALAIMPAHINEIPAIIRITLSSPKRPLLLVAAVLGGFGSDIFDCFLLNILFGGILRTYAPSLLRSC